MAQLTRQQKIACVEEGRILLAEALECFDPITRNDYYGERLAKKLRHLLESPLGSVDHWLECLKSELKKNDSTDGDIDDEEA